MHGAAFEGEKIWNVMNRCKCCKPGFVVLQEKLIKFILATQDEETGGISDRPGDMVCNNVILTAVSCSVL